MRSYRLLEQFGQGGMGRVFVAEHVRLGRRVALKMLRAEYADNAEAVKRFFAEARAVNKINHENIIEVSDFVENDGGRPFYIMELLHGVDLRARGARRGAAHRSRAGDRDPGMPRIGCGARRGHRSPGPEARQCLLGRTRRSPGLRQAPSTSTPRQAVRIRVAFDSVPLGATVARAGEDRPLGTTPFSAWIDVSRASQTFVFLESGWRVERKEVPPLVSDVSFVVPLTPDQAAPVSGVKGQAPPRSPAALPGGGQRASRVPKLDHGLMLNPFE